MWKHLQHDVSSEICDRPCINHQLIAFYKILFVLMSLSSSIYVVIMVFLFLFELTLRSLWLLEP